MSRGGYALLQQQIMQARVDEAGASSAEQVAPPRRHELWKAARTKRDGRMTSESAQIVAGRIVS